MMIKNIIFDMGNVLLQYDPGVCLNHFIKQEEDRALVRRELFEGPEWVQGDLGHITDEERFDGVSLRVPERLHEELRQCTEQWHMCRGKGVLQAGEGKRIPPVCPVQCQQLVLSVFPEIRAAGLL